MRVLDVYEHPTFEASRGEYWALGALAAVVSVATPAVAVFGLKSSTLAPLFDAFARYH